jgi:hypothetical protein
MVINAVCTTNIIKNINEPLDYYDIKPTDLILNDDQKEMIIGTLNNSNKAFVGMTLQFEDPVIIKYAIMCYVKINNIYLKNVVENDIKTAFAKYFMKLKDNVQFIAKSDLVTVGLNSNPEIESFDINIISGLAEETYFKGYHYKYELKLVNVFKCLSYIFGVVSIFTCFIYYISILFGVLGIIASIITRQIKNNKGFKYSLYGLILTISIIILYVKY